GRFLNHEKVVQAAWRRSSGGLSDSARLGAGRYSKTGSGPYDFCLPVECASENLFAGIREESIDYFRSPPGLYGGGAAIPWHDGKNGLPSTHLCDSQVCCVNFLFSLRDRRDAVTRLLKAAFEDCASAVPVQENETGLVEFEWVGDPSVELIGEGRRRTRGANATSTDAAACFVDELGNRHLVLIEWKYTESYPVSERVLNKFEGKSGLTRRGRYELLFLDPHGSVNSELVTLQDLGYEPFYQFLRQQLLADALAPKFASVRVLHLAPRANADFQKVTSAALRDRGLGETATGVWGKLVRDSRAFRSLAVEDAFAPVLEDPEDELRDWADYIRERYSFVCGTD
ncbi:MAG: hypothetical protein Q8M66_00125, partial [Actinomycetota bacterium]|nr:hypothetical protein [Actinomycetota bacterium]